MAADPKAAHVAAEWKHDRPLITCRFDPLGRYVFSAAEDSTLQRWDLKTGAAVTLAGHESWPRDIVFTPDGLWAISGGSDDQILWWETAGESTQPVRRITAHRGWVRALAVSPDGKLLASGGNDRLAKLWNLEDGSLVRELPGHEKHVYSVMFHPSGDFLISGDLKGDVRQWRISDGGLERSFDAKALYSYNGGQRVDFGGVRSLSLSGDGSRLACGGLHNASNPLGAVSDPLVIAFDWTSQAALKSHVAKDIKGVVWRVIHHAAGFLMAASGGSGGGWLLFWNADEEATFHQFKLPNTLRGMDLHPDGLQVATAHHDGRLRITRLEPKTA